MIRLIELRPSTNPEAKKVVDAEDGFTYNETQEEIPRRYLVAVFQDSTNPFSNFRMRMLSQQYDRLGRPVWRMPIGTIRRSVGQEFEGDIVTADVKAYKVQEDRPPVTQYSAVVFKHETVQGVFRNAGHILVVGHNADGTPIYDNITLPPRFTKVAPEAPGTEPAIVVPAAQNSELVND